MTVVADIGSSWWESEGLAAATRPDPALELARLVGLVPDGRELSGGRIDGLDPSGVEDC